MNRPPDHLLEIAGGVEERLDQFLSEREQAWNEVDESLPSAMAALRTLVMAPGKRLRAAFCHWGWVIAGGEAGAAPIIEAGAALELLQAFALIHDDVMDRSTRRRGNPAVHIEQGDEHRRQGWFGDSAHYGESAAVLIGNLAHIFADELLISAGGTSSELWAEWNQLRTEVNFGQFMDLNGAATRTRNPESAARILHYKSATYTIERPLLMGVALAGYDQELSATLSRFGVPLGQAFQLRDDVLGAIGDPETTGKPVGDDLREGKPTPLLAAAHASASDAQRTLLDQVGRSSLTDQEVLEIVGVLHETGAVIEIEESIEALSATAMSALDQLECSCDLNPLRDLASFVTTRNR